ncbi:HsdM family class I SAM-dependent methyltransferase [Halobacillus aidingensis]|uniref:site-specific DNA-methyltransferase (adenine-specific) n=1 Tax=Halobacillus aidingensis TaxID=240303 RepID=A0A1H0TZ94_HALAD|nr:N-6 DNA methylase [Halobacillus aidingensis]SDP59090.1 N-6 DNA Methylase [Halobacillus aidingensis]
MFSPQRMMGQYTTPKETVQYMTRKLLSELPEKSDLKILDPATGDGIFIHTLLEEGLTAENLYAFDIDQKTASPHPDVHFYYEDFLKVDQQGQYDAIIGNPPYKSKRQSPYFSENRERIEREFGKIGIHNLYSLFIHKGIQCLKPGGVMTMIVQDSFLTNIYYKNFREFLLKETEIKEIVLAPRRLFHIGKADVRTAIITLKKRDMEAAAFTQMRLVDRLNEQNYNHPPEDNIQYLSQQTFEQMPAHNFAINVPEDILRHFKVPYQPLGSVLKGGTGISTGDDRSFLREFKNEHAPSDWIPFYKNGGRKDAWYYEPKYYIHKNWPEYVNKGENFTVRNRSYFYQRGITCSSMGVDFSAALLPEGSLFGVNANLFPEHEEDLYYFLGLLNSKLIKYMVRKVLNRTNMITSGYIKKIPYIEPDPLQKLVMIETARNIVDKKKEDPSFQTGEWQSLVDQTVYEIYGISSFSRSKVHDFCHDIMEKI